MFQAFESPKSASATAGGSSTDATESDPYALLPQKIAFVVCQGLLFCVALYKVHTMGLLPTHSSDWLAFVEPNTVRSYFLTFLQRRKIDTTCVGTMFRRWSGQLLEECSKE